MLQRRTKKWQNPLKNWQWKKHFVKKLKLENEMQQYADQSAHIALQDHKKNFMIF